MEKTLKHFIVYFNNTKMYAYCEDVNFFNAHVTLEKKIEYHRYVCD